MNYKRIKKYCDEYFERIHDCLVYVDAKAAFIEAIKQVDQDTRDTIKARIESSFDLDKEEATRQKAQFEEMIDALNHLECAINRLPKFKSTTNH